MDNQNTSSVKQIQHLQKDLKDMIQVILTNTDLDADVQLNMLTNLIEHYVDNRVNIIANEQVNIINNNIHHY